MKLIDITGQTFGRLTVLGRGEQTSDNRIAWLCLCECGERTTVRGSKLATGHTRSCGCLGREAAGNRKRLDLTGQTFGRLTAVRPAGQQVDRHVKWLCVCSCGEEATVATSKLTTGHTRSCGCLRNDVTIDRNARHGDGRTKHYLHATWSGIIARCLRPHNKNYPLYGGRGIQMHLEWTADFWAFANWMDENLGQRPEGHSLDRIDVDGDYEPGNLRWAGLIEQAANQRRVIAVAERDVWRERALAFGWTPDSDPLPF